MPIRTREELKRIARAATAVLREEAALYDAETILAAAHVTGAQVRAVVEALEAAGYCISGDCNGRPDRTEADGARADGDDSERAFFGGPLPTPEELNGWGDPKDGFGDKADSEPEPSKPTLVIDYDNRGPARAYIVEPETPADPDGWTPEQRKLYVDVVRHLKRIAHNGIMPSMAEYDRVRGHLPTAQSVYARLGIKWSDIAARMGLRVQRGRRREDAGIEPAPKPEAPAVPRKRGTARLNANGLVESVSQATVPNAAPILHRAPDGGVTRILPRPDNSQAHSLPSAFAERNADGRAVRPAYRTEE